MGGDEGEEVTGQIEQGLLSPREDLGFYLRKVVREVLIRRERDLTLC